MLGWNGIFWLAGFHDVVWPVGSRSFGNALVDVVGPLPGSTGISLFPLNGVPYEFRMLLVELFVAGGIGRNEGEGAIV